MNEHKKFGKPAKSSASIDGIVTDGRQLGVPTQRSYQPGSEPVSPKLGVTDNRGDGFHAMRQNQHGLGQPVKIGDSDNLLDEPIVLDDQPLKDDKKANKKHRLGSRPSRRRKIFKRTLLALLALFLLGGLYFGVKVYITERHLFQGGGGAPALASAIDINQLKGEGDGRVNILLLGIGGPGHDGPDLTDTILLASIDPINHKAALLSIPRDLCVAYPCGPNQKLNAVYALAKQNSAVKTRSGQIRAGLNKLDSTLGPLLGIPIHYHAIVDFSAFKQAVNAVGGVDVNVPEELYDPTIAWENNYNPVIALKGPQHMNGAKALLYAKSRETSSDFARGERQRLIIVALKQKIFTLGTFSNPIKISNLLSSFGNNVYTDFSLKDTGRLYQILGTIPSQSVTSLDLITPPHDLLTTGTVDGKTSIVEPKAGLFDYAAITSYVRNTLRDGFLAKENAKVTVYNATSSAGTATAEATVLKSYGYNVTTVGNAATTNSQTTIVVDLSKGQDKYTRHYLEQRFNVTARTSLPGGSGITPPLGSDFVIIVGEDVAHTTR